MRKLLSLHSPFLFKQPGLPCNVPRRGRRSTNFTPELAAGRGPPRPVTGGTRPTLAAPELSKEAAELEKQSSLWAFPCWPTKAYSPFLKQNLQRVGSYRTPRKSLEVTGEVWGLGAQGLRSA